MTGTLALDADRSTRDRAQPGRRSATIRVLPVPRSEPPTDDERRVAGVEAPPIAAQLLPLDLPTGVRVQRSPRSWNAGRADQGEPGGPLSYAGEESRAAIDDALTGDSAPVGDGAAGSGAAAGVAGPTGSPPLRPVDRYSSSGLPGLSAPADSDSPAAGADSRDAIELRLAARRLLATCVEVVGGYRPLGQLRQFCVPERFDAIVSRLLRPSGLGRGHGATRDSVIAGHGGGPPRTGRTARTGPGDRVTIRRVQICDVLDGVAEIAVVMARRDKVWAMAIRMELARGRWQCSHLEVV